MSYITFIERFIHPFIIYVVVGSAAGFLFAWGAAKIRYFNHSRAKAMLYTLPFIVPFAAYLWFKPFFDYNCILFKKPLGPLSSLICDVGTGIASFLTPVFIFVVIFAVFKAILSLIATRRILKKYGFAEAEEYPALFNTLENLCQKAEMAQPKIVVTKDTFARSFTMGKRTPVIILSEGTLEGLDAEELETVIAHELGHIKRSDSMLNWITVFVRDLMFFTPFSFMSFNRLATQKEMASDDFAISLTGKPYAFAQALIKVWRMSPRTLFNRLAFDNYMPHPNFVGSSNILEERVKRILHEENVINDSPFLIPAVAMIGIAALYTVYWFC